MIDKEYTDFCLNIERYTGIHLVGYKENQMKRRLRSLYEKRGYSSFQEYFLAIKTNEEIRLEFLDRMTINVSDFFRNNARWDVLEKEILPGLMENKRKLKVWSAACSTGEEPYSLAMLLAKYYPMEEIDVYATDIDEVVLEKAKRGIYGEYTMKNCPMPYAKQYFTKIGNEYHLDERIKKTVRFRKQDLLKDPFQADWDLIVCRNVMIYFTEDVKEKLFQKFADALRPGGVLFVGSTEQIFQPSTYGLETEKTFFYRKLKK